ncbi:hypothetical protein ACFCZT_42950, partial [Streptomyces sp. NPDC056230]|uniref:hypothetical protein n=1 Tax=Streptomyces sp. NPDC056230 TaxID=3345754 RepID=UPI0035DADAE7
MYQDFKDVNKKFNTYIAAFSNNKFIEVSHDKITKVLIGYCFRTYSSIRRTRLPHRALDRADGRRP